jgi:acyl carrier protein
MDTAAIPLGETAPMSLPSPADLRDRLRARIAAQCKLEPDDAGPDVLTDATPLITGGLLDSIRLLWLLTWIDDEFGVHLLPQDMGDAAEHYDTIAAIAAMIEAAQASEVAS